MGIDCGTVIRDLAIGLLVVFLGWFGNEVIKMIRRPCLEIMTPTYGIWYIYPRETDKYGNVSVAGTASYDQIQYLEQLKDDNNIDPMPRLFIHIPIHNKTKTRWGTSTAKQVCAKTLFHDLDEDPKTEGFNARWKETDQPQPFEDKIKYEYINIPPDEIRTLDISFRKTDGKIWYAWNNDNYDNPIFMEIDRNKIGAGGFRFRVIVTGDNVKTVEKRFRVNDGEIEFFELDKNGNDK